MLFTKIEHSQDIQLEYFWENVCYSRKFNILRKFSCPSQLSRNNISYNSLRTECNTFKHDHCRERGLHDNNMDGVFSVQFNSDYNSVHGYTNSYALW